MEYLNPAFCDTRMGGNPKFYIIPPKDIGMRVPPEVKKCVCFIARPADGADGTHQAELIGTAFFVGLASKKIPRLSYLYLVTARHVAEQVMNGPFWVRVNTKDGSSKLYAGNNVKWIFHPDENVDVALFPWGIPFDQLESKYVSDSMFLTDEVIDNKNIGVGNEVLITGLFHKVEGKERNLPIVRVGNVAMMEDELIPTSRGVMEVYLIEARSIGGISGSPVFVYEEVDVGTGRIYLMGLMHGHWDISDAVMKSATVQDTAGGDSINMGIAIVVPAKKIIETLNVRELVDQRNKVDKQREEENLPVADAVETNDKVEKDRDQLLGAMLNTPPETHEEMKDKRS